MLPSGHVIPAHTCSHIPIHPHPKMRAEEAPKAKDFQNPPSAFKILRVSRTRTAAPQAAPATPKIPK